MSLKFQPSKVTIETKGEHFSGSYRHIDFLFTVTLLLESQGRVRLQVKKDDSLLEDEVLRLPTTNSLPPQIQAMALIMSAMERHIENH